MERKLDNVLRKFRNAKFVHNGRSLDEGIDCLGFIILFYKEFGVNLPSDDGRHIEYDWYLEDPERYVRGLRSLGHEDVPVNQLKPLDLIYFVVNHDVITHSGILLPNNYFAHMTPKKGFRISRLERHWMRRIRGGIRVLDI